MSAAGIRRPGRSLIAVVVLALIAILLAVLLPRGGTVGPGSATNSPGPTFNVPAALVAQVDEAGLMRTGGIWAVQGSYFLTSTDNGGTWRAGTFPSPRGLAAPTTVFVLDPNHAWAIASSPIPGSVASPDPTPAGELFEINRTSDGGRTWQTTPVSGHFPCDSATVSFVDADRGFVMCSVRASAPNGPVSPATTTQGSGTVLRTDDGGATWSVAGSATGIGSAFTASDATTLWSAPDYYSSTLTGASLYVSRDAGSTWSAVNLPDLPATPGPGNSEVGVAAGPDFWDAADGAIALSVFFNGSSTPPAVWFYRTSDGGRSWTLVRRPTRDPMMGGSSFPQVLAGREWAAIWLDGFDGMTTSDDFGSSWSRVAWSGVPANSPPLWLAFSDKDHAVATVLAEPGTYALMQSTDGGRTWHPASFGDARARVSSKSADPTAAQNIAAEYVMMAGKDPPTAWNMLSSYSQRAFGSEAEFEAAETTLGKRTGYAGYQLSPPTQSLAVLSQANLGSAVWNDLNAFADITRSYVVTVSFPGTAEAQETLVVAPLSVTGGWRVWVVGGP